MDMRNKGAVCQEKQRSLRLETDTFFGKTALPRVIGQRLVKNGFKRKVKVGASQDGFSSDL